MASKKKLKPARRLTDEQTITFINFYLDENCLWNPLDVDYRKQSKRQAAYKRIAVAMGIPDFDHLNVAWKIKNLRTTYVQEVRKVEASESEPNPEEVYKPKLIWFDIMDEYIRGLVSTLPTKPMFQDEIETDTNEAWQVTENEGCQMTENKACQVTENEAWPVTENKACQVTENEAWPVTENKACQVTENEVLSEENNDLSSKCENSCEGAPHSFYAKRSRYADEEVSDQDISRRFTYTQTFEKLRDKTAERQEDTFELFGRYVAATLRNLPSEHAFTAEYLIQKVLTKGKFNARSKQED